MFNCQTKKDDIFLCQWFKAVYSNLNYGKDKYQKAVFFVEFLGSFVS